LPFSFKLSSTIAHAARSYGTPSIILNSFDVLRVVAKVTRRIRRSVTVNRLRFAARSPRGDVPPRLSLSSDAASSPSSTSLPSSNRVDKFRFVPLFLALLRSPPSSPSPNALEIRAVNHRAASSSTFTTPPAPLPPPFAIAVSVAATFGSRFVFASSHSASARSSVSGDLVLFDFCPEVKICNRLCTTSSLYFGVDGRPRAGDALRAVERGVLRVVGARAGMTARAARCAGADVGCLAQTSV
jgi:hypothetical protein